MPPKTKPDTLPVDQPGADQAPPAAPASALPPDEVALTLPPAAPDSVALHLAHPVKHDGTRYGPGEVTVTPELAETFRGLGIVTE